MYKATTPVLSVAQAEDLGRFLARYAIRISGLTVYHILRNGERVRDDPLRDTVVASTGSMGTGATGGSMLAAAGFTLALSPVAMVAMVAALPALVKGIHENNRNNPGGRHCDKAVLSELQFDLADVSPKRRRWCEYLLAIYAARRAWTFAGFVHPEQITVGARYAATNAADPPPWGEQAQPPTWANQTRQAAQPTNQTNQAHKESRVRRLARELW